MPPLPLPLPPTEPCTTCAAPLSTSSHPPRRLPCCARLICASCLERHPRFRTYCPFCQISSAPSVLGGAEVGEPPGYSPRAGPTGKERDDRVHAEQRRSDDQTKPDESREQPPAYTPYAPPRPASPPQQQQHDDQSSAQPREQTHYLRPDDSIASLSLRYGVPASVLRAHNRISADHLLHARHSVLIPSTHYDGPSLSPTSLLGAEEEERRRAVRRFMVATKVVDEGVARVYVDEAGGMVGTAVERYRDDERWEVGHPMRVIGRGRRGREVRGLGRDAG